MEELSVKIVRLEPMRVVVASGFGPSPEPIALEKLKAWMQKKGIKTDGKAHRVFGYNNPNPHPGSPNYGYDFLLTVGPEVEGEGDIRVMDFAGGLYAVSACKSPENLPAAWKQMVMWRENSVYLPANHQWLEEHTNIDEPDFKEWVINMYLPVRE